MSIMHKIIAAAMAVLAALGIALTMFLPSLILGMDSSGESYPFYGALVYLTFGFVLASIIAAMVASRWPRGSGIVYLLTFIVFLADSVFLYNHGFQRHLPAPSGYPGIPPSTIIIPMVVTYVIVAALFAGSYFLNKRSSNAAS